MRDHFLNAHNSLVLDSLRALSAQNPTVALDEPSKVVYLRNHDRSKVALVCGGGSGHEPAHAGFVGTGMLTSAVCGNIFASPNPSQVRRGIDLVDNDAGTLIVVKNYTGDVLNFGLAKEQFAALHPEKANKLKFLIVGDDVAVGRQQGAIVGRRGLAGTVLVYKIAGGLAERGASLEQVFDIGEWVSTNLVTVGASLGHTHVPGTASSNTPVSSSEVEIGMGIHNEAGHSRLSPVPKLSELISQLINYLTSDADLDRAFVPFVEKDKNVVLFVNNLGGLSELELGGVVTEAIKQLESQGFTLHRVLSGTFMTSLDMPGFSITLLRLPSTMNPEPNAPSLELLLSLLDDRPLVPAWKWCFDSQPQTSVKQAESKKIMKVTKDVVDYENVAVSDMKTFTDGIRAVATALIREESEITRMDSIAGDGDCGLTLKAGAEEVLVKLDAGEITGQDISRSMVVIAQVAETAMGGTIGALYSIFFSALAQALRLQKGSETTSGKVCAETSPHTLTQADWRSALKYALSKLYGYTRARPPSRTLMDPLVAFIETFAKVSVSGNGTSHFQEAVVAASEATDRTKDIPAKAGRSAYIDTDLLIQEKVSDPGAWGVKVILENLKATYD